MNSNKIGPLIILFLFILLAYAGYISQKSIDYDVLKKMESQKLILPTQIPSNVVTPATTK